MNKIQQLSFHSPVGDLTVSTLNNAIVALDWGWSTTQTSTSLLKETHNWINKFFKGNINAPNLPLHPAGSKFQKQVWAEMAAIPFGETRSYGDIARKLNTAAQAVGNACGANPIPLLIPCHRVIGSNGLGGYSGGDGLSTKTILLRLEGTIQ